MLKLSVGRTSPSYLLEIEGLLTQGSRPGRTFGESMSENFELDSSGWSNGIRYHIFDTRPDTEFKVPEASVLTSGRPGSEGYFDVSRISRVNREDDGEDDDEVGRCRLTLSNPR
jgi:hypothetical protein